MAQITLTIPDDKISEIVEAFAFICDYATNKLANETKAQFAKRHIISHIKSTYKEYKSREIIEISIT